MGRDTLAGSGVVGRTAELWRFPVKSMLGEKLSEAELTDGGIVGDRAYALVDVETGKVASAKSVKQFPDLFGCRATFLEAPRADRGIPPVQISLPDGASLTSDAPDADAVLSRYFRRDVHLASAAPEDFTIDQYHPDVADLDPAGHRDTFVEQKLGAALLSEAGMPSILPEGAFFDLFPVSVLTTSTLDRLNALGPGSRFDARRFRMNIIVDTGQEGFVVNGWVGLGVEIGETVRLRVAIPDPRCVMTTLAQEDLPKDTEILRTLTRHNRIEVGGAGRFPCAGVYSVVESPGTVRTGDAVVVR
jgi:uncharacterized protein YcbX